jgi:hypothetical protein
MELSNKVLSVDVDWVINHSQFLSLITFLNKRFNQCDKIIFIDSHHDIVRYLEPNEDFIVNIDNHHDIIQLNPNSPSPDKGLHMGNWVNYLVENNRLNHYIWINNVTSKVTELNVYPLQSIKTFKMDPSLDFIDSMEFKKIIICKSFEYMWQPEKDIGLGLTYEVLKSIALNIFKEKVIISNNPNPYKVY